LLLPFITMGPGRASQLKGTGSSKGNRRFRSGETVPWKDSTAKQMLTKDLNDGMVTPDMKPKQVFQMREELYTPYAKNFASNYRSLQRSILALHTRRDEDDAWVAHDRLLCPPQAVDPHGYPRWDGSAAQRLLKQDVAVGKHEELRPKELRSTRIEYMQFPLKTFRDHIHQEKNSEHQKSYWLNRGKKDTQQQLQQQD
jgi:hypothetical protein